MGKRKRQPPGHIPNAIDLKMPLIYAVADLMPKIGVQEFRIGYEEADDEGKAGGGLPVTLWWCGAYAGVRWEFDCAEHPEVAAVRLAERLVDGGTCPHCSRTVGLTSDWQGKQLLEQAICWWKYDPETVSFRRDCDGNEEVSPREV